ncbi:carboxypeptidase-like regulatory domain-containing protein [Nocardioides acrostichi]|uniref:Carboxypeptidase regulatory-like domain-containing protein n=1 Tax=Nocardioides acrostichi TaxID=2784339 RepID=A0A930V2N2_9ACTN|nr:carboxypeptidase-like regulatory domain-containing protein [Nocardioides acrostichi]MBF4162630.1 carboxypeptidase regulatory-like domain-containing protein [Nocardioides acrostichi]
MVPRTLLAGLALALTPGLVALAPAPAHAEKVPPPYISGVVVDDLGRPVDDVLVEAKAIDWSDYTLRTWGSAFTYANQNLDGPQHGYFHVEIKDPDTGKNRLGLYDLRISKDGYDTAVVEDVRLKAKTRTKLGDIVLERLKAKTRTTATAVDKSLVKGQQAKLKVAVKGAQNPGGDLIVQGIGKKRTVTLKPGMHGKALINFGRLKKTGTYTARVVYTGSEGDPRTKGSQAKPVTFKVTKPTKRSRRATAPRIVDVFSW